MATSVGWAQGTLDKSSFEGTEQDVTNFKSYMGIMDGDTRTWKIIYGNGYEMTIEKTADASSDNQVTITFKGVTFSDGTNNITITNTDNAIIFGGSKETDLEKDTKIILKSGSVGYLIGGGWGTRGKNATDPKTANIKNVGIDIQGGSVGLIYSGGLYRSNVNDITLNVKNATVSHIYCGGFDQGQTTNTLDTEWSSSVNHVNKSTLTMENSTVLGYLFLGGGQGYSYSKEVEAHVSNSTLHCGILGTGSNGRSDKVTATVTECKFEKTNEQTDIIEIAPLNRGIINEISMTFDGCTFPSKTSDYAAYLGATYAYDGKSKVELGKVDVDFKDNCKNTPTMCLSNGLSSADATVTGAKVIAAPSVTFGNTTEKAYTIGDNKTWIFNNGFEIAEDVTLTKTGTLVVQGTFTISKVDQLPMALSSVKPGGTIDLSSVTSENMLNKLNGGDKEKLTAGICIICSDATVYTDETSAQQSTSTGTIKYIKLAADTYSLETPKALTVKPTIKTKPVASTLEAGQPLSASILSEGIAIIEGETEVAVSGVFSWKTPSEVATVGTKSYDVIFTPTDLTKYEVVNTQVEIKDVKQYYTVTIGKCDNGKVEVTEGNSAGKYEDKKVLSVKAIPNEHYDFSAWGTGITGDASNGSYTVSKNDVLTATFVAKEYKVTIGENVKVTKQDGTSISTGNLPYGTVLNVVAAPKGEVGSLKSLTYNDKEVINNTVTVDGALNIQATFNAVVPSTYRISLGESVENGKIQLFDDKGNAIAFGSALTEGTVVSVVTVPDPGYELDGSATAEGATYENGKFTVAKAAVTVSATFKPKKYTVTTVAENVTITLDKTSDLDKVDYGTSIKIKEAKAKDDYKLLAVVVNGKEIAEGESFIVKGDTKVNAVVQKLPDVVFTDVKQIYTYNKEAQAFVVRTVPAGISGIKISYEQKGSNAKNSTVPTDAGTYKVFATLEANSSYASMNEIPIGTLEIKKAPYPVKDIPTVNLITNNNNANEYHWRSEANSNSNFRTAYYKLPDNLLSNYREPEFVIPSTSELENNLTKVTLGEGSWVKTRSTTTTVSLTLNATNGSVSVWNGDVQVTDQTPLYAGQKLTLKAIPADATYSARPKWGKGVTVDDKGVASITLPNQTATVEAEFKEKDEAPFINVFQESEYNGTAFGTASAPEIDSNVSGWLVTFKQGKVTFDEPTAVGEYQMIASRPADDIYNAAEAKEVGTLRITQAKAVISDVVGTDITTFQTLNQSVISGTANVEGTFSWVNPDTKLAANEYTNIDVLFTPTDNNYAPVKGKATVKVTALASEVAVRTIELTESDPANGNGVVLTLNGTEVTAGTTVKAGDKLTATFSAKEHYTASAKINDASYTSGNEYEVKDETGNVTIAITYTQKSGPTPTPNPEPDDDVTNVTGVSLDATSKTLAVGESFALKATVKPAYADNKKVSWSSSDATIASVDKDGNVKALKAGTCKITATTEDGDYTATCDVTVTIATGIDEILTVNRIYTDYRQIIVEPTTMLEVLISDLNGRIIYNGRTTEKISVSASGGMYIVRLIDGKRVAATKVIVK